MIENLKIKNVVTEESIELTMSSDVFVLEKADFGVISSSHQTYHYPGQKGYTKYASSLGTREPTIIGWVIGDTENEISERKAKLNALINPLEDLEIEVEGKYHIVLTPATTVQYSATYAENNDVMCKFQIKGTCFEPIFSSGVQKSVVSGVEGNFIFPLVIPEEGYIFSKKTSSLISNIKNKGTIDGGIEIIFSARGTVVNPSLVNVTTQECFKLNKVLSADEVVRINTSIGSRSVIGILNGEELNYFKYRSISEGDWVTFKKGENLYRYNADEGLDNLDVTIRYNEYWLEVDN